MNIFKTIGSGFSGILGSIALLIIVLHLGGLNIYHHTDIPFLNSAKERVVTKNEYSLYYPWYYKVIDITLEDEIKGPNNYKEIIRALRDADRNDIITFHLFGYGGSVESTQLIVNNIRMSKAWVHMSVEAPVYSGHAYLALSGKSLYMAPYTYLMLHYSSVLNEDCSTATGSDRGVDNKTHCEEFLKSDLYNNNKWILDLPVLYPNEKLKLLKGYDVYITSDEYNKRAGK